MGNTSSSSSRGHHDDTVDYGHLAPQGVYTGPKDWNHGIVTQLIVDRRLAPFYRPLEDYNENWDDDQIMSARRVLPDTDSANSDTPPTRVDSRDCTKPAHQSKRPGALKETSRCPEAAIYRGAVECPICFLIKRTEPTATHLVSEPAACPYCVQENFGVVYTPPTWRTGIGSDGTSLPVWSDTSKGFQQNIPSAAQKRRKSFGHDSPEVVTTDSIRPDWEAKLAAVRAAVTRRANRRIIMRQVGDRLIPVGVTSGRVHPLPTGEGQEAGEVDGSVSRRSRRHRNNGGQPDIGQLLGQMGLGGQDLEELMVMEAMRLSLLEHEEQQRKEEEKRKKEAAAAASGERVDGDAPGQSSEDQTATDTVGNNTSNILSAARSLESGETLAEANHGGNRAMTPVAGQPTSSSHSQTPVDTSATRSDGAISISAHPQCLRPGTSSPMIGDGIVDSTASAVSDGVAELSSQNASMYIDSIQSSAGTPGAASITSSTSSPNTLGQSLYDALPSSPESSMEQPLLNTDSIFARAAAKTANS
ncbi:hypothetical protein BD769DRAFT_1382246 [Suillus cothurnatus]|nr:hypothetical protein BD769DRAFT_1382246 [Suillus cothurnatus]